MRLKWKKINENRKRDKTMGEMEKIQQEIQSLKKRLAKLEQAEQGINQWIPEDYETYWTIGGEGGTVLLHWLNDKYDKNKLSVGEVFKTKEEASFELEQRKVIVELRQYAREFVCGERNWHLFYNFNHGCISYDYESVIKRVALYFESEQIARKAVAKVGEDRVKKYYCSIKD